MYDKRLRRLAILLATVAAAGVLSVAQAGPASACTVYPGTSVYCWPSGGGVPVPHRPVPHYTHRP